MALHHLVIPARLIDGHTGEEIRVARDGVTVARTYVASGGWAVAMVPAGPLELRVGRRTPTGAVRWPKQPDAVLKMPRRDTEYGALKLTGAAREWLRLRNMTHTERVEHEHG